MFTCLWSSLYSESLESLSFEKGFVLVELFGSTVNGYPKE